MPRAVRRRKTGDIAVSGAGGGVRQPALPAPRPRLRRKGGTRKNQVRKNRACREERLCREDGSRGGRTAAGGPPRGL